MYPDSVETEKSDVTRIEYLPLCTFPSSAVAIEQVPGVKI